jgi:sterol desaturase/sphingolipid hydroxylase (fatty acid hydroxylase superfamily)
MPILFASLPAIVVVLLLTAAERMRGPARTDWWRNLQAWAITALFGMALPQIFTGENGLSLLDGAALPFWLACPLFVVVRDFGEFAYHRAQHRIPLLWSMHSMHHSDPEMSALTTQRHFWGDQFIKSLTIWPLASMIIAPTPGIVAVTGLMGLWNFVSHARLRIDLGRWSWIINTPAYHRRHHSCLPEHYDSNFAGLLPIFDVVFGSYHRPDGYPPTGLPTRPESFGELVVWPIRREESEVPVSAN